MADYQIKCEVTFVDTAKAKCQKVGDTFTIGPRTPAGMCCRAFMAVFSAATGMRFSEQMKWEGEDGSVTVKCPDGNVAYRLTRIKPAT